jgi:hypothetical protein
MGSTQSPLIAMLLNEPSMAMPKVCAHTPRRRRGATPSHRQAAGGGARWPARFSSDRNFQKKIEAMPCVCAFVFGFLASVCFGWSHGDRTKNSTRQLHESFVIKWMCKCECRTHRESALLKSTFKCLN